MVTRAARASATMIFIMLNRINLVPVRYAVKVNGAQLFNKHADSVVLRK